MRILFAASEAYPLAKTGGLGDVAGALPSALAEAGDEVRLLLPAYRGLEAKLSGAKPLALLDDPFGKGDVRLIEGSLPGLSCPVWLVDCPQLYDRAGGLYQDAAGLDWSDNAYRFGLLSWVAARLAHESRPLPWAPEVLHLNDWQTGLAPAFLAAWGGTRAATIFSIHNIAYQGNFAPELVPALGLPWSLYQIQGLEYYGHLSFLKAGCFFADHLTTVSPTYAREIQTAEHGHGLQGLLAERGKDLIGILNGVDYGVWSPARDSALFERFDSKDAKALAAGKRANKAGLRRLMGLSGEDGLPLMAVVSRLNWLKGMDLVLAALPQFLAEGAQLALLGTGDADLEASFRALARAHPDRVVAHIGYSEELAHKILAAADILLMPSRSEPCGLTQMYAYRYGAVPVVVGTGGLADSVTDWTPAHAKEGTGFVAKSATPELVGDAIRRALTLHRHPKEWNKLTAKNAALDFGWPKIAELYRALYRRKAAAHPRPLCY